MQEKRQMEHKSESGGNRRRASRVRRRRIADIYLYSTGQFRGQGISIEIDDLSERGLGFNLNRAMARGEQFVMLSEESDREPKCLLYTVAHCDKDADGRFRIGAEFTCVVSGCLAQEVEAAAVAERIRHAMLS
jgi:hypothetical protein